VPQAEWLARNRVALVLALLAGEVIALTVRFDSGLARDDLFNRLLGHSRLFLQALTAAAAIAMLLWPRIQQIFEAATRGSTSPHRAWAWLLAHLVALGIFTGLTSVILEGGPKPLLQAIAWAFAWAGMGLMTLSLWFAIWLPPDRWLAMARGGPGFILGGLSGGLAAWGAGTITAEFWRPLGYSTLATVHRLLRIFFRDTVCQPQQFLVGTSNFHVEIAPGCSGFEGIGLTLVLIGMFLWISRNDLRFPQSLLLLPIGVFLSWLANAVRITTLIAMGASGLRDVALSGFHSVAGWLAFIVLGLGLITVARSWSFISREPLPVVSGDASFPSSPYLLPLMALLATSMATKAFEHSDRYYFLRVLAAVWVLWCYRRRYTELRPTFSWQAAALGAVAFVLWMALEDLAPVDAATVSQLTREVSEYSPSWRGLWITFRLVGTIAVVPLAEELAFRGYLTRRLIRPDFWAIPIGTFSWPSFLVSSALFGLLHGRWLAGLIAGMIYALTLYRRRELSDAVLAHAVTNALIAFHVLNTGQWSLWT
jgi:exosortase E/protease (VPEID-CTERM system)